MIDTRIPRAQEWLAEVVGAEALNDLASAWREFNDQSLTVVTLFGAYDTGKSAIVRRLLVDAGLSVPDWVTISARHETYEAGQVEVSGYILQDTPGISDRET